MVSKNRLTQIDRERIAWAKSFKAGEKWLLKLRAKHGEKPGTQKYYVRALKEFSEYVEMDPDEIIEAYKRGLKEDVNRAVEEWNDRLDLFVPWLVDKFGFNRSVAASWFSAIKSFFKYNVAIKLTATKPEFYSKSYKPITIDELRDNILPFADIYQTFEILFLKDSGISQDDVLRLNVGDIEDLGNGFGHIKTFREKEGVDYETFIGPNTTEAMRKCLDFRRRLGFEITNESPLFVKKHKPNERLTASLIQGSLRRLSKKAGVIVSTHRLRKTFETFLAVGKVHPIILKYWMGHKIKRGKTDIEAKYIIPPKPDQLKVYMEGYKFIDISPQPNQTEIFLAEVRTRMETLPPEQRKRFLTEITTMYRSRAHVIREDPKIKALMKEQNITQGGLAFDTSQFEEIDEKDLLRYLRSGWRITHNLQNGRVIVERH
jgi:integrase